MTNIDHFERYGGGRDSEMQCPAGQYDTPRTRDQALPIPAPDLHDVNRRLAEWAPRVDRHDLVRLAADHDLIIRPGGKAQIRRGDPHLPVALLNQPRDLPSAILPHTRLVCSGVTVFMAGIGPVRLAEHDPGLGFGQRIAVRVHSLAVECNRSKGDDGGRASA
jgi:hypothetical protein